MTASYREFLAEQGPQHVHPVNRWCAVFGNPLLVGGPVLMLLGRRRSGAIVAASGSAIVVSGHLVEGNLLANVRAFFRHPIWSLRDDFAVARDAIKSRW